MTISKNYKKILVFILILGALEFFIAVSFIFAIEPDPKNAILLGFSASRWSLLIITGGSGIACLVIAHHLYRNGLNKKIEGFFIKHSSLLLKASVILFIIGIAIILIPSSMLGKFTEFFDRLRPLLIVLSVLPFQFFIPRILKKREKGNHSFERSNLIIALTLVGLSIFIALTKFGVTPDTHYWNVAGVPLTALQLTFVFLITLASYYVINKLSSTSKVPPVIIDITIVMVIYIFGVWIWTNTPMVKHFNALQPAPPVFQYFPYSDARVHDLGAVSILDGYGIYFGEYTDKPLYMIFLSILHRIAGDDYNMIGLLHLLTMGLILPGLYWLGKQLHSRHLGIAIATIILIRQRNAIFLAHMLAGTNPRLLLTEMPTMLGIIILCVISFSWIRKAYQEDSLRWPYPLLAGGILGALSLVRLNPIGLLPLFLLIGYVGLKKTEVRWGQQLLVFMVGFLLVFTPWVLTGRDANGYPYLWVKFIDVLNVRYTQHESLTDKTNSMLSSANSKMATLLAYVPEHSFHEANVQGFPAFVINHSIHNMIASFLTLPDSIRTEDQTLKNLIQRPYLDEKQTSVWKGEIQAHQIPFLIFNMVFFAIGLSWCWKQWKLAGLFPILIFVGYVITLGFARNSGSRYIVPIDWIIFLYYMIGIFSLFEEHTTLLDNNKDGAHQSLIAGKHINSIVPVMAVLTVAVLSISIPLVQMPLLTQRLPPCNNQINEPGHPQFSMLSGKVLYPYLSNNTFSFVFLTCDQSLEISIPKTDISLQNGQFIIIGFSKTELNKPEAFFLEENSTIQQIWPEQ